MSEPETSALHAILELLRAPRPDQLRRAELLVMRQRVIDVAMAALHNPDLLEQIVPKHHPRRDEAVELILAYEGEDRFLLDLKRTISVYGGLTEGQREAVLRSPSEGELEELMSYGYGASGVTYAFQAIELIRRGRREARQRAREEAATDSSQK